MKCLCVLEVNCLSVTSFANIFSNSVGCLFVLFMVSFSVKKLLSIIRPHLFIFVFVFINPKRWIQNDIADIYVRVLCLFSSKRFILSGLIFKSLIHFKLLFVWYWRMF